MSLINSGEAILRYLAAPLVLTEREEAMVRKLDCLRQKDLSPYSEQMKSLLAHRLLGSNTLQSSQDFTTWQAANDWVGRQILQGDQPTIDKFIKINSILLGENSQVRNFEIYSGGSEYLPPENLQEGLSQLERVLESETSALARAFQIYLYLVTLHPFENGNGRTARLAADWGLLQDGYLPLTFDSPIQSHVAVTLGSPPREKCSSFFKFLAAIKSSYDILMEPNRTS